MTSLFDILARYWQVNDAHPAPSAKPWRYVRGNFGAKDGTIEGLAPKGWNGPRFSPKHGGAYSKASASLMPVKGHNLQKGKFMEPTTSRKPRKVAA